MTTTRETEKPVEPSGEFMVAQCQEYREKKKKIRDLLMNEHKERAPFPSKEEVELYGLDPKSAEADGEEQGACFRSCRWQHIG